MITSHYDYYIEVVFWSIIGTLDNFVSFSPISPMPFLLVALGFLS